MRHCKAWKVPLAPPPRWSNALLVPSNIILMNLISSSVHHHISSSNHHHFIIGSSSYHHHIIIISVTKCIWSNITALLAPSTLILVILIRFHLINPFHIHIHHIHFIIIKNYHQRPWFCITIIIWLSYWCNPLENQCKCFLLEMPMYSWCCLLVCFFAQKYWPNLSGKSEKFEIYLSDLYWCCCWC